MLCDWIVESEDEGGNEAAEAAHLAIENGAVDSESEPEPDDQEKGLVELSLLQQNGNVPKNTSKDPSKVMSEFNRKQRMKCLQFCQHPDSGHNLVLMRIAMTLCVTFLRSILVLASDAWQNRQHAGVILGKPWSCRMLEAHRGELSAKIRSRASLLLHQDSGGTEWKAVPPLGRTFGSASKALSMVATATCTLDFLAFTPWQGMPYAMWSLLSGRMADALWILMLPLCLLGSWARDLICNFVKPVLSMTAAAEILLGNRFQAVLVSLGAILRYDICALECRNAQIRRFAKHSQTWRNSFQEASARFLMMRHRVTRWRRHPPDDDAAAKPRRVRRRGRGLIGRSARAKARAKAVAKVKARPKTYRRFRPNKTVQKKRIGKGGNQCGGGWHRAAVGDYLRGLSGCGGDDRVPLLEAANAFAREVWLAQDHRLQRYCELGRAATLRRRFGGKPLARKMKGGQPSWKRRFDESHPDWSFSGPFVGESVAADPKMGLHLGEVQAWAEAQPKLRMQQSDLPAQAVPVVGPGLGGARGSMDLRMVECKPPSQALLDATLDASAQVLGSQGKLVEHWGVIHETVSHCTAPAPLKKAKSKKNEVGNPRCLMSSRCVCCLGKDSLVMRLQAALKSWFCKGGLGRGTYSRQGAVFCLSRAGIPDDCARWFFIGCGDLRNSWFITLELVPCGRSLALKELLPGFHVLECISSGSRARPHPLYTLDVDSKVPWHVQLFGLQFESHELMVAFRPVALVRAVSDALAFWSPGSKPPPPARKKLVIKPLADVPALVPLADILPADNNLPAAQSEDAGQPGEDPVNDAASDAPASPKSVASSRGVDGVGGVLDDSDAAADVGWEVTDTSSGEDDDGGRYVSVSFLCVFEYEVCSFFLKR